MAQQSGDMVLPSIGRGIVLVFPREWATDSTRGSKEGAGQREASDGCGFSNRYIESLCLWLQFTK